MVDSMKQSAVCPAAVSLSLNTFDRKLEQEVKVI